METALRDLRDEIVVWIDDGAALGLIDEELIGPAPVGDDERAALWLFAWSYAKRRQWTPRSLGVVA